MSAVNYNEADLLTGALSNRFQTAAVRLTGLEVRMLLKLLIKDQTCYLKMMHRFIKLLCRCEGR